MKLTTVPFFIPRGKYKNIDNLKEVGSAPVFCDIPTEEDFEIAVSSISWKGASERVVIDFDLFIVQVGRYKKGWFLTHEHSYREPKTSFHIGIFETFEQSIERLKTLAKEEAIFVESLIKKLNRALNS